MQTSLAKTCDLHIHSTFSDSNSTIEEVFTQAKAAGLSCIAICDHDTVAGLASARSASLEHNIEVLPAIEISAQKDGIEVHILGYLFDPCSQALLDALGHVQETRKERIVLMIDKLNAIGLRVDKEELFCDINESVPTRLHLALYLIKKGYVNNLSEAFRKYLSPGKPAYISRFKYSVEEAIRIIKNSGGLSFIAHPYMLAEQSWIEEFARLGVDGLEVVYPRLSKEKISFYATMAERLKLLKSGGSDAHGSFKSYTQVGSVSIPYEWVAIMKERAAWVK